MSHFMRKLLLALAACAVAGIPSGGQQQQAVSTVPTAVRADPIAIVQTNKSEERYSPTGGGFSVLMSGKPLAK